MPLYAAVCETNITPPPGVWMSGYGFRPTGSVGVHDELYARVLVADNGDTRIVLITCDLIALDGDVVAKVREGVAAQTGAAPSAVMVHCTHTHGGPCMRSYRCMGTRDDAYVDVMVRKVVGAARQAADSLQPTYFTYGENSVQIGVNRRQMRPDGSVILGQDFGGPIAPIVQTLGLHRTDGRLIALLFSHACHGTTMGGDNLHTTAEWPGAAVEILKERFRFAGHRPAALPFFLQGCCGDINPMERGTWEAMESNGRIVADAAHLACAESDLFLDDALDACETTVELPMLPPPSVSDCDKEIAHWEDALARDMAADADEGRVLFDEGRLDWARAARDCAAHPESIESMPFTIQCINLGGARILGFSGEMFVQYQLDFSEQAAGPVLSLAYTNGCLNYVPTAAEYARGGYEIHDAFKYYGTLMFAPESEAIIREAVYDLLGLADADRTPYTLQNGRPH